MAASRRAVASSSAPSSSTHNLHDHFPEPPRWKYDVFLSFQGEGPSGTRNNFTDVLYTALCRKGIVTFKDDKKLRKGRIIGDDLMMAIEDSALFLVVFSRDYASSKWCLDELAKIMECFRNRAKSPSLSSLEVSVLPIFHDVEAKDVRKQKGSFEESFLRHGQDDAIGKEKVLKWKTAMTDAGNMSGWVTRGRKWTEIVDEITRHVFNIVNQHWSSLSKYIVGFDSHVQDIMTHLIKDSVCFVGICGMGGIGKTTLADAVYRRIRHCFEASIFLSNIRETLSNKNGLVSLQKQLISKLLMEENILLDNESDGVELIQKCLARKKVLIILDDVDHMKQLEALAARSSWFGIGSKVIITTRDRRLLDVHGAIPHMLEELNDVDALKLFCQKAFHSDCPPDDYAELSHRFIDYAKGVPLALETLGSSLIKRTIPEWESTLSRLALIPEPTIIRTLRISYDGLDESTKEVFLYIACFFKGKSEHRTLDILSSCCGFNLRDIVSILKEKSLVKELDEKLWMHDLIQEMGQEIVRQESPRDLGSRRLLWDVEDIHNVLRHNMATDSIRGIVLNSPMTTFALLTAQAFSKMRKLRLLILHDVPFYGKHVDLSNELRFLKWKGFPFHSLPKSFEADNLVELNLPNSHLKELWCGAKNFPHLKVIKLSYSRSLSKTPDFAGAPRLEKIILEGCLQLQEVHESIGTLKKLTVLDLANCKQLEVLPDSICNLLSLRFLDLSGCSILITPPRNLDFSKRLKQLKIFGTPMKRSLTSWLSCFRFLAPVSYRNSSELHMPPLSDLRSLTQLILVSCNLSDAAVLNDLSHLRSLELLELRGNKFVELPPCFTQLTKLKRLNLGRCKSLQSLPALPSSIERVRANDCPSLKLRPDQLITFRASKDSVLNFFNCRNLFENDGSSNRWLKMLLENYLQPIKYPAIYQYSRCRFDIFMPGNSIPEWIRNQSESHSVSLSLPDSSLQEAWNGLIMCGVFVVSSKQDAGMNNRGDKAKHAAGFYGHHVTFGIGENEQPSRRVRYHLEEQQPKSDHIWLGHVPRGHVEHYGYKRLTVSFEGSEDVIIKSCGADLTFEQEVRPTSACEITQLD